MAENKTKPTGESVEEFIRSSDPKKIEDSFKLVEMMEKISGEKAYMWGPSIVGFGNYHYKYESGREGDAPRLGFSPRKSKFSLYVLHKDHESMKPLLERLGKVDVANGGCIYFKKMDDLDTEILEELLVASLEETKRKWG